MKRKKICFVQLWTYSLFYPSPDHIFGGSEIRGYIFAKALSEFPEYEVSFVVFDNGQPKIEQFDGIKVFSHSYYKLFKKSTSLLDEINQFIDLYIGHLNPLQPKIGDYRVPRRKIKIYNQVDADIYFTFGAGNFSAELTLFCKKNNKPLVFFTGSVEDISEKYYQGSDEINSCGSFGGLCYFTLMNADYIITQNQEQARIFKSRFNRSSITISNPIDLTVDDRFVSAKKANSAYALWIGKSDKVKQPDIFIKLAKTFPELRFVMIMNKSNNQIHEQILEKNIPNLQVKEYVPFNEIESYYRNAAVLINTSVFEGFPNTFLQAGKYGVPLLSLNVDPDHFIERNKCGIVAYGDFEKLKQGFSKIIHDRTLREQFSRNARKYVYDNHRLEDKVIELHNLLQGVSNDA